MTEVLKKMVDGVIVDMTPEEQAEFIASMPQPMEPPVPSVTPRQLRLWLIDNGVQLSNVDDAINAMAIPESAKQKALVEWEYATVYQFDNPLVAQIGALLGLDETEMKAGFAAASLL